MRPWGAGVGGGSVSAVPDTSAVPARVAESMDSPGMDVGSRSAGTGLAAAFPVNSDEEAEESMEAPGTQEDGEEGGAVESTSASNCSS